MSSPSKKETLNGQGPFTDPTVECFGLPCGGRVDSDSAPFQLRQDKMIDERYGKPGDDFAAMTEGSPDNVSFNGPGMPGNGQ